MRVGVAGLGLIGARLAANWVKAGHEVAGWNRTRAHATRLGLPLAETPAKLAEASDVVMIVVADPPALREVVSGPGGVASVPLAGRVVVNASTVSARANREADAAVRAAGGRFLETPFTGSKEAAEAGRLVFYAGGEAGLLAELEPLLLQVGRRIFHFGPVGAGADAKLAMNLMLANMMQAMAEGFLLAARAGLPAETFTEAFKANAGWSLLAEMKVPKIVGGDFSPHFALKHMDKDLRLAVERAREVGAAVPHSEHLRRIFAEAMGRGWMDEDFSVLYRHIAGGKAED